MDVFTTLMSTVIVGHEHGRVGGGVMRAMGVVGVMGLVPYYIKGPVSIEIKILLYGKFFAKMVYFAQYFSNHVFYKLELS